MKSCSLNEICEHTAKMLEAIPLPRADAVLPEELCPAAEWTEASCRQCVLSLLAFLQVFDVLNIREATASGGPKIKARSEIATYFLRSLSQYVRKGLSLTGNWDRPGVGQKILSESAFASGAHLVYFMENKRVKEHHDTTPIRKSKISQAIIKANVRGHKGPVYLVQWDERADQFQLIGGHMRLGETDPLEVMKREIREELPDNQFAYPDDYTLQKLADDISFSDQSPTVGAFTEYNATLYQVFFKKPQITLRPNDKWVTWPELLQGKTKQGRRIAHDTVNSLNSILPGNMEGLKLSLEETQKRPLKEILIERKWEIIGIVIGIIGIAVSILLYFLSKKNN